MKVTVCSRQFVFPITNPCAFIDTNYDIQKAVLDSGSIQLVCKSRLADNWYTTHFVFVYKHDRIKLNGKVFNLRGPKTIKHCVDVINENLLSTESKD